MLITLLLWVYISAIAYANGLMVQCFLAKGFGSQFANNHLSIVETTWLGLAWLMALCGYAYWVSAVSWELHLVALLLPLLWHFLGESHRFRFQARNSFSFKTPWLIPIALLALAVILSRTTLDPRIKDTGGYHAQMIRWIEEFPVAQGLANLNYRLGFNNSWFLANALFSFSWFKVSFHVLNGWAMGSLGIQALLFAKTQWRFFYGALFVLFLYYFHWQLSSPSPDLPAHLLVALVFGLWLRIPEKPFSLAHVAVLILSFTAFTIKTSTAPLLLLVLWIGLGLIKKKQWGILLKNMAVGMFFLVYWLVGNVILTGYLLYPVASDTLDFFNFDWEVPRQIIIEGIGNLTENTRPPEAKTLPFPLWLPHWIARTDWTERVIYALVVIKSMLWFGVGIRWKRLSNQQKFTIKTLCIAWIGIVFWLSVAPMLRFGIGFVAVPLVLDMPNYCWNALYTYGNFKPDEKLRFCLRIFLCVFLSILLYSSLKRQKPTFLSPREYPKAATRMYENRGMKIYVAANDTTTYRGIKGYWGNCYHHPLPCTPYQTQGFEPRGRTLQEGFRAIEK